MVDPGGEVDAEASRNAGVGTHAEEVAEEVADLHQRFENAITAGELFVIFLPEGQPTGVTTPRDAGAAYLAHNPSNSLSEPSTKYCLYVPDFTLVEILPDGTQRALAIFEVKRALAPSAPRRVTSTWLLMNFTKELFQAKHNIELQSVQDLSLETALETRPQIAKNAPEADRFHLDSTLIPP
ncbi:hypothetical protein CALVIDRAFT_602867 [Calocera viscosa TUFC12733]|uniref:Uncharacterized protein n=1 Tax=Calocera viscosa (strain TUFC12733) TaxID=1330018 RepID=A0A167GGZ2_CALVF|nr:hypothetical protein CALVIDRAFT_602867 [Calocera viscosa TUFC12733]